MRRAEVFVAAGALVGLALAGCIGSTGQKTVPSAPAGVVPPEVLAPDGRDLRRTLVANDTIDGPRWQVGQWFGHHFFLGAGDTEGTHMNAIVYKEDAEYWYLAGDDREGAKIEAVWDIPLLGQIKREDLSTTFLTGRWDTYEFPLHQGKTWKGDVELPSFIDDTILVFPCEFTVTYAPKIETPDGDRPGFEIVAVTNGTELLKYDFVPDIGWYAHFYWYDIETDDPQDYIIHSMSMGHGLDWKGTVYLDTARSLAAHLEYVFALGPSFEAKPYATFTVAADSDYLYGFVFSIAVAGAHELLLVDPQNTPHEYRALGVSPEEADVEEDFFNEAAQAGEWRIVSLGGGIFVMGGVFLWEIKEETLEVGGAP